MGTQPRMTHLIFEWSLREGLREIGTEIELLFFSLSTFTQSIEQQQQHLDSRPAGASDLVAGHEAKGQLNARHACAVLRRGPAGGPRAAAPGAEDDEVKIVLVFVGAGGSVLGFRRGARSRGHSFFLFRACEERGVLERGRENATARENEGARREKESKLENCDWRASFFFTLQLFLFLFTAFLLRALSLRLHALRGHVHRSEG